MLYMLLSLLQQNGGIFLGSNVILSRLPRNIQQRGFWFDFSPPQSEAGLTDVTRGVVIAMKGFDDKAKTSYVEEILRSKPGCVLPEVFDAHAPEAEESAHCVFFNDKPHIYPTGIMYANTSFGQLSRWVFYGTRAPMHPKIKQGEPIPRISHLIWFSPEDNVPYQMEFYQFLTILSALYVGGFHHVYIHGNAGFRGPWWDRLRNENVTFVRTEEPEMVYQQQVKNPSHKSDVLRFVFFCFCVIVDVFVYVVLRVVSQLIFRL